MKAPSSENSFTEIVRIGTDGRVILGKRVREALGLKFDPGVDASARVVSDRLLQLKVFGDRAEIRSMSAHVSSVREKLSGAEG